MKQRHHRRIRTGLVILTGALAILALRLAWIQMVMRNETVPGGKYTLAKMAEVQSEREVVLDSGRGRLYDRCGLPLAGETVWTAVFFPPEETKEAGKGGGLKGDTALRRLASILGVSLHELKEKRGAATQPFVWPAPAGEGPLALTGEQAGAVSALGVDGVTVLPFSRRYDGGPSGRQWLGHLSEASTGTREAIQAGKKQGKRTDLRVFLEGTAGLEKTLEPLLRGIGHTEVFARVDARGSRLPGSGLTVRTPDNPYYPLSLYTTIDRRLQEGIEALARRDGVKEGAVVVLDADSGDISAMVSLPFYDPENISPEGGEWNNRALQAAVPGSIFKIVTAAAALEAGVTSPDEVFRCDGEYDRYGLKCPKAGGHGKLTLAQGFARSCNTVFATLAERLSGAQLESAALALGLGREIGWRQENALGLPLLMPLGGEQRGTIFAAPLQDDAGARVQTAIGQRDAAVTPLQAANLVVTLLHGGEVAAPRILRRVDFANGQKLADLPAHTAPSAAGRISAKTTALLLQWMRGVVTEGTGASLRDARWPLAGKSGTAQTVVKGAPRNNQWFIGFGPADRPRYAAAVLVRNAAPGSPHAAAKLFGKVMDLLAETESGLLR